MAIVLKINLGDDTRRISFDKPPSYEELTQIVKQLFRISVVQLKYEDEDKDRITVTSQIELNEAYQLASRHLNNVLRVFVSETPVAPTMEANFLMKFINSINMGTASAPADVVGSPAVQEVLTRLGLSRSSPSPSRSRSPPRSSPSPTPSKTTNEISPAVSEPVVEQPGQTVVHRGVTCDGCKTENITGIRYKCTVCCNYDLCESCKAKGDEVHPTVHVMNAIKEPVTYVRRGRCYRIPVSLRTSAPLDASSSTTSHRPAATFIKHVNYARPELMESGTKITKTWRVRNDGTTAWPVGTVLMHVGGSEVPETSKSVPVPLAAPGEEVDVSADIIMPSDYFVCYFRLCTSDGDRFGKRMRACFFNRRNYTTTNTAEMETQAEEEIEEQLEAKKAEEAAKEAEKRAREIEEAAKEAEKRAIEEEAAKKQQAEKEAAEAKNMQEAVGIAQLTELGFSGDLLAVLRKNGGDVNASALELMGGL